MKRLLLGVCLVLGTLFVADSALAEHYHHPRARACYVPPPPVPHCHVVQPLPSPCGINYGYSYGYRGLPVYGYPAPRPYCGGYPSGSHYHGSFGVYGPNYSFRFGF